MMIPRLLLRIQALPSRYFLPCDTLANALGIITPAIVTFVDFRLLLFEVGNLPTPRQLRFCLRIGGSRFQLLGPFFSCRTRLA